MSELTVAVLLPTTGRALQMEERVSELLYQTPPAGVCLAVVLSVPADDTATMSAARRLSVGVMHLNCELHLVSRAKNTHAVYGWNIAFSYAYTNGADWFVLGADDVEWHRGWLQAALDVANQTGKAVIGLNDGITNQGDYSSHYMMRRDYAAEYGFIPAGYQSWWFDRDVCQAAQARGEYAAAVDAHAEHMHPDWQKAEMDATYRLGIPLRDSDQALYRKRKEQGFR